MNPDCASSFAPASHLCLEEVPVAWTGKYSTAEQTSDRIKVTAHVDTASSQAITGNDRVYFMRVDGDKLTVKSPGVVVPVTGQQASSNLSL